MPKDEDIAAVRDGCVAQAATVFGIATETSEQAAIARNRRQLSVGALTKRAAAQAVRDRPPIVGRVYIRQTDARKAHADGVAEGRSSCCILIDIRYAASHALSNFYTSMIAAQSYCAAL